MTLPVSIDESTLATDQILRTIERVSTDSRVMVAYGFGINVAIRNGHLAVSDGIGKHRRIRKIPKADRTINRLVITGGEGYITLGALRWCRDHGTAITILNANGDLTASHTPEFASSVSILRTQALAGSGAPLEDKGIEVMRALLAQKLYGQSANLVKLLSDTTASVKIDHYAAMLSDATTLVELNELERWSANTYFSAWRDTVSVPWSDADRCEVPANWLTYGRRKASAVNTSKRYAIDPVNAMLNYAYTIGYAESRIACLAHGLHPALGFSHADSDNRDSLALDVLEAIRPDIDSFILGLLGYGSHPRTFTRKDFCEPYGYPHGTVRLVAPLTHEIAEQSVVWQDRLSDVARDVAGILGAPIGRTGRRSHNLAAQKSEFTTQQVSADMILTDSDWQAFRAILPSEKSHPEGGFAPISSRNILAAMIYLERHHKPWAHVPLSLNVSPRTMRARRQEWKRLGCWQDVWSIIQDLAAKPIP